MFWRPEIWLTQLMDGAKLTLDLKTPNFDNLIKRALFKLVQVYGIYLKASK